MAVDIECLSSLPGSSLDRMITGAAVATPQTIATYSSIN